MFCLYVTYHSTGKFYVGKSTVDAVQNKHYIGSGIRLFKMLKKYPKKQWITDIVQTFENETNAYEAERLYVDEALLADPDCLNLALGGLGQRKGAVGTRKGQKYGSNSPEHNAKIAASLKGNPPTRGTTGIKFGPESSARRSKGLKAYWDRVRAGLASPPRPRGPNRVKEQA